MITNFQMFENIKNWLYKVRVKYSKSSVCAKSNNCTEKI